MLILLPTVFLTISFFSLMTMKSNDTVEKRCCETKYYKEKHLNDTLGPILVAVFEYFRLV